MSGCVDWYQRAGNLGANEFIFDGLIDKMKAGVRKNNVRLETGLKKLIYKALSASFFVVSFE